MPKLSQQPLCLYCGCKIRKKTSTIRFGYAERRDDTYMSFRTERPKSRAEAQKLVNEKVVSSTWCAPYEAEKHGRYIDQVTVWDGESYQDELFCNGEHARLYGYAMARAYQEGLHRLMMPDYRKATTTERRDGAA